MSVMKLSDLQLFVDVVESGGMTQAALIRGVSQPGISRIMRDLETQMRARLLRRTGRGVELTPAGTAFLGFARDSLAAFEETRAKVDALSGAMPDRLAVAVPPRIGRLVFSDLYRRFLQDMPDVAVTAVEELTAAMAEGMIGGRRDLLLSYLPSIPGSGDGRPAFEESLYLVGRDPAPEAPVSAAEVAAEPVLLTPPATRFRRMIDGAFAAAGLKLCVAREVETAEGLLAFAAEGEGRAIMPFSNCIAEAARGEVYARKIVNPSVNRRLYLHAGRHIDHRVARAAMDTLQRSLATVADEARWRPI